MEYIDNKMENWKKKFRYVAQEEVKAVSEDFAQKTLEDLDKIIDEKKKALKEELLPLIRKEVKTAVEPSLKQVAENIQGIQGKVMTSIGLAVLALAGILILQFIEWLSHHPKEKKE